MRLLHGNGSGAMHHTHPWFTKSTVHNSTRHTMTRRADRCSLNVATNSGTKATADVHRHSKGSAADPYTRNLIAHRVASGASTIDFGGADNEATGTNWRNGVNTAARVENHLQSPLARRLHTNCTQNCTLDPVRRVAQCTCEYRDLYPSQYLTTYLSECPTSGMHRYLTPHCALRLQDRMYATNGAYPLA